MLVDELLDLIGTGIHLTGDAVSFLIVLAVVIFGLIGMYEWFRKHWK